MFHITDKILRNILVSCDHGLMCVNRFDFNKNNVGSGQVLLDHGNSCTAEAYECIEKIKNKTNPVIFDVGANIGTFTTWLSKYFTKGKIYAFEPQRLVFQMLCANLAINNLFNVYAYNIALGSVNQKIKVLEPNYNVPNDFGTFSLVNDTIPDKSIEMIIDICTIDSFANQHEITNIDLIKIDTEGMDLAVLHGAINTIKKFNPVIFVEFFDNNVNNQNEIQKFLNNFDYKFKYINNNILAYSKVT